MSSTIKNIIILVVVAVALGLAYFFFLKPAPEQPALVPASGTSPLANTASTNGTSTSSGISGSEFLTVLLNVKTIKLDDAIFSDSAFNTLHDSSIELINNGTEGRPNPFAPLGSDVVVTPTITPTTPPATSTVTPPTTSSTTTTPPVTTTKP